MYYIGSAGIFLFQGMGAPLWRFINNMLHLRSKLVLQLNQFYICILSITLYCMLTQIAMNSLRNWILAGLIALSGLINVPLNNFTTRIMSDLTPKGIETG